MRLEVDPASGQSGPYPVELGVRVTGKVIGPPTPESGSGGPAPASDDDGTSDLVLAVGGLAGIVLGVVAGGAAAGLGRRRTA